MSAEIVASTVRCALLLLGIAAFATSGWFLLWSTVHGYFRLYHDFRTLDGAKCLAGAALLFLTAWFVALFFAEVLYLSFMIAWSAP